MSVCWFHRPPLHLLPLYIHLTWGEIASSRNNHHHEFANRFVCFSTFLVHTYFFFYSLARFFWAMIISFSNLNFCYLNVLFFFRSHSIGSEFVACFSHYYIMQLHQQNDAWVFFYSFAILIRIDSDLIFEFLFWNILNVFMNRQHFFRFDLMTMANIWTSL